MIRKAFTIAAVAGALVAGASPALAARPAGAGGRPGPLNCVGAPQHKAAQQFRIQALQSGRAGLAARLGVAQGGNHPKAVARITANIAKVDARIALLNANIATFGVRCP